jgi:hypothetical protein
VATRLADLFPEDRIRQLEQRRSAKEQRNPSLFFPLPEVVPSQRFGQKSRMGMGDHFRRPVKTARNVQFVFETALAIAIGATSPNFSNRRFRDAGLSAIVGARAVDRRHREE